MSGEEEEWVAVAVSGGAAAAYGEDQNRKRNVNDFTYCFHLLSLSSFFFGFSGPKF